MKLPDDPKQRNQILILSGIGVVIVLYVGITFGIKPLIKMKTEAAAAIEDSSSKTKKAAGEIKHEQKDRTDSVNFLVKAKDIIEPNVLLPTLANNYLIPAQEIIESCAKAANLEAMVKELGTGDFKPNGQFRAYRVGVTLECGYNELVAFLTELEKQNECLSVPSISIAGQSGSSAPGRPGKAKGVEKHTVILEIHWPIWATPAGRDNFNKRVQKAVDIVKKPNPNEKAK